MVGKKGVIYEVFPLLCPICGGQMRTIAFITFSADTRQILEHIGVQPEPPRITPARGPPLWDGVDAQMGDGVDLAPDWSGPGQPAPLDEHEVLTVLAVAFWRSWSRRLHRARTARQ